MPSSDSFSRSEFCHQSAIFQWELFIRIRYFKARSYRARSNWNSSLIGCKWNRFLGFALGRLACVRVLLVSSESKWYVDWYLCLEFLDTTTAELVWWSNTNTNAPYRSGFSSPHGESRLESCPSIYCLFPRSWRDAKAFYQQNFKETTSEVSTDVSC